MKCFKIFFISILFIFSCKGGQENQIDNDVDPQEITSIALQKAKTIYYSLPTPIETAMVLENTNVEFNDQFLLPIKNVDFYETSYKQAIALGIYISDLSYCSMYSQNQEAIEYLSTSKKLIQKLGLIDVITDSVIQQIENNIGDKTDILNIISEQYLQVNAYLDENNMNNISTLIILGGYIESLHIAVKLADNEENPPIQLYQIILEQRIPLKDLLELMKLFKNDTFINKKLKDFEELNSIYQKVSNPLNKEDFTKIYKKVTQIRSNII